MKKLLLAACLLAPLPAVAQEVNLGVNPCTAALVASCILKNTGGQLFSLNAFATAASYVMIVDSATVPVPGTVSPVKTFALAVNTSVLASWIPGAIIFTSGITVLCSSAVPPTYTAATTCLFSGETR